ncbi:hypothetical protein PFICI_01003 [Pestalotiopsis fici W106-1]|uniref:Rhodopsin domain-containing protein n=1 Tax=Pestalotiopsis fici (strain W106-1 / CGMCC3.15140) TaxID=1229662 RepID=W3XMI5_PESFW|nr:uncharacterized protein PFICI_01003 [Pestalotiopsis fici W106-1]ETS87175.1 hypothetical protein PFICI_01003 [Pestalotiopsis fici W106-1]
MSNSTSAFIGQPPNTERDWYIVRGFLRGYGMYTVDPGLGYTLAAQKPYDGYTYAPRTPGIIVGLSIVIVAIVTATGTRLALRAAMSQMRFGADDWATIAAAAMGITYTACQLCMATHGGGKHIWDVTYEEYNVFYYYGVIDKFIFYVTVGLVKISLTLFIRRLADRASRHWKWFCDFFLVTLILYIAAAIFWEVFTCTPARAQWDKLFAGMIIHPATCQPSSIQGVQNLFFNITHVVQGVILLLSPMVILWKVQMDKHKKARLFGMWTVGLIAVICGLMRQLRADFSSDLMWDYTELLIWTALDVCVGIITISLPVMDAWLAGAWRGAVSKVGRSGGSSSNPKTIGTSRSSKYINNASARRSMMPGAKGYSHTDSVEDMIHTIPNQPSPTGSNDETELHAITRTDEYSVHCYSSAANDSDWDDGRPGKAYTKHSSRNFSMK